VQTFEGLEPWLILRYDDAKAVLLDDSRFSIDPTRPGFPEKTAGFKATIGQEFFGDRSTTCFMNATTAEEAAQAGEELYDYLSALLKAKERSPADDMISALAAEYRAGNLTREQAFDMGRLMLVAGHETTANQIALSCLALLGHEPQLDDLKSDASILGNSVDELLRYLSVAHLGRRRAVLEDVDIRGHQICAGEGVIVANNVADPDPRVFPDPHKLDLRRPNARANLAFGYGIHQCIGQQLSRVELQVIHGALWRRFPSMEFAVDLKDIRFKSDAVIYGVWELPVDTR